MRSLGPLLNKILLAYSGRNSCAAKVFSLNTSNTFCRQLAYICQQTGKKAFGTEAREPEKQVLARSRALH